MKKTKIILVFMFVALLTSCTPWHIFNYRPKFTFVQKSKTAIFDGKVLTLHNVQNPTIFYSKYPNQYQLAGHVENQIFIDSWNEKNKDEDEVTLNSFISYHNSEKHAAVARIHINKIKSEQNIILFYIELINDKIPQDENLHDVTLFIN